MDAPNKSIANYKLLTIQYKHACTVVAKVLKFYAMGDSNCISNSSNFFSNNIYIAPICIFSATIMEFAPSLLSNVDPKNVRIINFRCTLITFLRRFSQII